MSALKIQALHAGYGASTVLRGVDLDIGEGELVAVVGRNGAGKSTLLMSVFRETNIFSGEIWVGGARIDGLPGYAAAKLGVSISPQGRRILPNLTVRENLLLGRATGRSGRWELRTIYELFPVLAERANSAGTMLSGGQQQMLAIGRALMANPALAVSRRALGGIVACARRRSRAGAQRNSSRRHGRAGGRAAFESGETDDGSLRHSL